MESTEEVKTLEECLSEATGISIEELKYRNEIEIIRPSEALEAMNEFASQDRWVSDEEIENILNPLTPQSKGFYYEQRFFGAKLIRDLICSPPKQEGETE